MNNRTFAVGTVAQKVLGPGAGGVLIQADAANTVDIYIGAQYVTADLANTGGIRIGPGAAAPLEIDGNEPLWAIAPSGTQYLRVLTGTDVE